MAKDSSRQGAQSEDRPVDWEDLCLTLNFHLKDGYARYMGLFVPDHDMYCYVNLWAYLRGEVPYEEFLRTLPLTSQSTQHEKH